MEMEAEDWRDGHPVALPPVTLSRQSGFKAEYRPPLKPGYYRVRYRPVIVVDNRRIAGSAEEFSSAVYGIPPAGCGGERARSSRWKFHRRAALTRVVSLDGDGWLIATDPKNEGRQQKWSASPVTDARPAKVPWPIQDVVPGLSRRGLVLARLHRAGLPVSGRPLSPPVPRGGLPGGGLGQRHLHREPRGGRDAVRAGRDRRGQAGRGRTRLAVRVLNPTYEPIDGIALKQTPSGAKQYPVATNSAYNCGGILDSVELLLAPAVRIEDLHVIPDWKTGEIRVRANVRNAAAQPTQGIVQLTVAPAAGGESLATQLVSADLATGRHAGRGPAPRARPPALAAERSVPVPRHRPRPGRRKCSGRRADRCVAGSAISASRTATSGSTASGSSCTG